jgi:pentatricopeptide repeat protein
MRFVEERTFPSTRPWDFVFFDRCIDTGVHDPSEGRQRIFSATNIDEAGQDAAGHAEASDSSYTYRPFVLDPDLFKFSETDVKRGADGAAAGSEVGTETAIGVDSDELSLTPIVGLDTVTTQDTDAVVDKAKRAAGEVARRKLELPESTAAEIGRSLPERVHACWFLLYRSYVRRKSEKVAQEAIAQSKATQAEKLALRRSEAAGDVGLTRQERLDAMKEQREDANDSRTASASKGLHVSFDVISQMHEAGLKVPSLCYRSLMEMCSHSKLGDFAKLIFESMQKDGLEMDTICYNAFVNAIMQDDQEHLASASFKTFRPYRCLPDHTDPPDECDSSTSEAVVELRACTGDGVELDCEDEALALAVWGVEASPYDDCLCLPPLYIEVTEHRTLDGEEKCHRYAFVSPFTLVAELEALLAHWGDSLVTVVTPASETQSFIETQQLRLRREHPTVRLTSTFTIVE